MPKPTKNKCLETLMQNIADDRNCAKDLLYDASKAIMTASPSSKEDVYRNIGPQAAKYLEVLQKINDQIVKVIQIIEKEPPKGEEEEESADLSSVGDDSAPVLSRKSIGNIYDILEKEKKN